MPSDLYSDDTTESHPPPGLDRPATAEPNGGATPEPPSPATVTSGAQPPATSVPADGPSTAETAAHPQSEVAPEDPDHGVTAGGELEPGATSAAADAATDASGTTEPTTTAARRSGEAAGPDPAAEPDPGGPADPSNVATKEPSPASAADEAAAANPIAQPTPDSPGNLASNEPFATAAAAGTDPAAKPTPDPPTDQTGDIGDDTQAVPALELFGDDETGAAAGPPTLPVPIAEPAAGPELPHVIVPAPSPDLPPDAARGPQQETVSRRARAARQDRDRDRRRKLVWAAAAVPILAVVLLGAAFAAGGGTDGNKVSANVELAGTDVSRMSRDELAKKVGELAFVQATRPVVLRTAAGDLHSDSGTLGLHVDQEATIQATIDKGKDGFALFRPFSWAASYLSSRHVELQWAVDRAVLDPVLPLIEGDKVVPVVEPALKATGSQVAVANGHPGNSLSADAVAGALTDAARTGGDTLTVEVDQEATPPRYSDQQVQAIADDANRLLANPLTATFGLDSRVLPTDMVAPWLRAAPDANGGLSLQIDDAAVDAKLKELYAPLVTQPKDAGFTVIAGAPVLIPAIPGIACCGPGQSAKILAALQGATPVTLDPVQTQPAFTTEAAQALGIKEEVGQPDHFGPTTHHVPGQPRVTNIHLIADAVRGHVILPGETFSLNGFVGERTAAKGYVEAPMIDNGIDVPAIGGGVSQFATTTLNAAFYAGLDIKEYQSHSLYLTRYPRGREATISWKKPDLKIQNTTPYGVLIWPEYNDTTLTVRLYSTHYVDAVDLPTTEEPRGNCTRVTTPRVRTYLDGRVVQDSVFATYRPAEGVNC